MYKIKTVKEQILDQLRFDILSGQIKRGEKLNEQKLANRFGVSRGPIRDVLQTLHHEGLLVYRPNEGMRVAEHIDLEIQDLIVELRKKIEFFAVDKVLKNINDAHLAKLQSILNDMKEASEKDDYSMFGRKDMEFHQTILEIYGSADLLDIWSPLFLRKILHYKMDGKLIENYYEHVEIFNCLKERNKEKLLKALDKNIRF